jgi:hypothetical protein
VGIDWHVLVLDGRGVTVDRFTHLANRVIEADIGDPAMLERLGCILARPTGAFSFLFALPGDSLTLIGSALGDHHADESCS